MTRWIDAPWVDDLVTRLEDEAGEPTVSSVVIAQLRDALVGMIAQFGYYADGALLTGGLSALEEAFDALGWEERHEAPELACEVEGCGERKTCGQPTPGGGYLWTCDEHFALEQEENKP